MEKIIISREDLHSFLGQGIENAVERHKLKLTSPAQQYLVEMLEGFAEDFDAYQESWLAPITFQYQRITEETSRLQRTQLQRELGDHCLFLLGCFYEFVLRGGEGMVQYHVQIGSNAYQQTGRHPFTELAQNFDELYLVIGDLHLPQLDEKRIVELYGRWEKTRDPYYASLLIGKGIVPQRIKTGNN